MSRGAVYTLQPTIADTNLRNCCYVFLYLYLMRGGSLHAPLIYWRQDYPTHLSKFSLILPPDENEVTRYTVLILILKTVAHPKSWHCQKGVGGVAHIPQNLPKKLLKLSMIFCWWPVGKSNGSTETASLFSLAS